MDAQLHWVIASDPAARHRAGAFDSTRRSIGMVAGQPVLIKDNIEAAGALPTTPGSLALANNVTNRDAPPVARLRAAGAIILRKTKLSERGENRSHKSISGGGAGGGQGQ